MTETVRRPVNIAHRGITKDFPDNTLEAFLAAFELGADGIEFDVRETADHRFVIYHDRLLRGASIERLSYVEVERVKLRDKYTIPTLEETLDLSRGRGKLVLEIKQLESVALFLHVVRVRANLDDVTIASFHRELLVRVAEFAPEMRRAVIAGLPVLNPVKLAREARAAAIAMRLSLTAAWMVRRSHEHNLGVAVWDCAGIREVRQALRLGVDVIISDTPDVVVRELTVRAR